MKEYTFRFSKWCGTSLNFVHWCWFILLSALSKHFTRFGNTLAALCERQFQWPARAAIFGMGLADHPDLMQHALALPFFMHLLTNQWQSVNDLLGKNMCIINQYIYIYIYTYIYISLIIYHKPMFTHIGSHQPMTPSYNDSPRVAMYVSSSTVRNFKPRGVRQIKSAKSWTVCTCPQGPGKALNNWYRILFEDLMILSTSPKKNSDLKLF